MKRFASVFFLILTFSLLAGPSKASGFSINNLDSVLFDLSQAVYSSNRVEFPVYFNSDDTINAVDFAFRFNQSNLTLDTIINISSGLQSTYFLNPGDSVLRFSSYNLSRIPNLTDVAIVRFLINTGSISITDFYDFDVFLNGFRCSWRVFDGTNDIAITNNTHLYSVYPVPATSRINLFSSIPSAYMLTDNQGRLLFRGDLTRGNVEVLEISRLDAGVYFVSFLNTLPTQTRRILVID